jgi:hypothetical protein
MHSRSKASLIGPLALVLLAAGPAGAQRSGTAVFDHFTTAFRLDGAHQFATCESCHVDGLFAGAPLQCSGCHAQGARVRATSQPAQHMLTTELCDSCHRTTSWVPVVAVDHVEVFGTCVSCHDGGRALGKPPDHIPASDQCDDCHRTIAFSPATFEHAGITGGCFTCHNGTTALGKPVDHIPATNICEDCHNVVSFSPVARVDHAQVLGVCSGCHNNVIAPGQFPGHIPTTAECDTCHNTTAWKP